MTSFGVKDRHSYESLLSLLKTKPTQFLALLDRNLIDGGSDGETARLQLDIIAHEDKVAEMLQTYRNEDGDTVAHTTATFHPKPDLMTKCFDLSPDLLLEQRKDDFAGQTSLHIVIAKGNRKMARAILEHPNCQENCKKVLKTRAVGSKFKNTVMMGQLPLSVAALTFDTKMVKLLLKHGADIGWYNKDKDTVFHSLIKFANVHSDKTGDVLEMMGFINAKLSSHNKDIWHKARNKDKLTPLTLAADLGLVEIFTTILNLDGVYRSLNAHDGLFDIHLYDITEIDTITQAEFERFDRNLREIKGKDGICTHCYHGTERAKKSWNDIQHRPALRHKAPAVLDIICKLPVQRAFEFISVDAVHELISQKWNHYKWFYILWAIYHLLLMVHITTFAIYKTKVINSEVYPGQEVTKTERDFVYATAGVVFIYACIYLLYELIRSRYFKQGWHIRLIQHNGIYRLILLSFSIFLVFDATWLYIHPNNNYFLILSLILGWTYMTFFLRTWKRFSFYTVMFQKILFGDMTRLSVIILFQLVAFSIAIYTAFLNTRPVPAGFENFGLAAMTMFKLMLGLTDIEVLHDAREPWLVISLYVLFVLVTYVLLINSLIAMMSRTCDLISEDRNRQWELQRLSVILLVETMLLPRWRYLNETGIKAIRRYGLRSHEFRCYIELTSIQTTYRDGKAVLQRKSLIDTIGFGNNDGTSIWSPFFRTTGPHSIQDPLNTLLHGTSMQRKVEEEESSEEETEDNTNGSHLIDDRDDATESSDDSDSDTGGRFNLKDYERHMKDMTKSLGGRQHTKKYIHQFKGASVPGSTLGHNQYGHQRADTKKYHRVLLSNVWLRHQLNQRKRVTRDSKKRANRQATGILHATGNQPKGHIQSNVSHVSVDEDSVDLPHWQAKTINPDENASLENLTQARKPITGHEQAAEQFSQQRQYAVPQRSAEECAKGYIQSEDHDVAKTRPNLQQDQQVHNCRSDVQSSSKVSMCPVRINDKPFLPSQTKDPQAELQSYPNTIPIQRQNSGHRTFSVSVEPTTNVANITPVSDFHEAERILRDENQRKQKTVDRKLNVIPVVCDPVSLQIQHVDMTVLDSHI